MSDRIEQLERLTRLKADGTLSDDEFEREKRRLLDRRWPQVRLFVLAGLAAVAAIIALIFLLDRRSAVPVSINRADSAPAVAEVPALRAVPSLPPVPPPLDISSRIRIVNGDCRFAPDLERAFGNMLHYEGNRVRPREVRFGTMRLTPSVTSSRDEGVNLPDFRQYESVVIFNVPVMWNGLRLTGLRSATGWEWGSSTMEFADNPARVRGALQSMGIQIPASGILELPAEACPNSIAVAAQGTGAVLSCGGGC